MAKQGGPVGPEDAAIGAELQAQRKYHGLSRETVVEQAGIGLTHLREVEAGVTSARLQTLYRLCEVIGISFRELLDGADRRIIRNKAESDD